MNELKIKKPKNFLLKHIFECGQVFRYKRINDNEYEVFSTDKKAILKENIDELVIYSKDIEYFKHYLDLDRDYQEIIDSLKDKPLIKENIQKSYGIRILNQDPYEMIISFIISANNNIPRIKKIIQSLCERYGKKIDDYYSFPNQKELSRSNVEDLKAIGLGYRAKYIEKTAKDLKNIDFLKLSKLDEKLISEKLLSLQGVGPKVLDCILLFGFHKENVFPMDTWTKKIYNEIFKNQNTTNSMLMRKNLTRIYSPFSSYAQQYLFYSKRVDNNLDKIN